MTPSIFDSNLERRPMIFYIFCSSCLLIPLTAAVLVGLSFSLKSDPVVVYLCMSRMTRLLLMPWVVVSNPEFKMEDFVDPGPVE